MELVLPTMSEIRLTNAGHRGNRIVGFETEYSLDVRNERYHGVEFKKHTAQEMAALALQASLAGDEASVHEALSLDTSAYKVIYAAYGEVRKFLLHGPRRYIDGTHPEYATEERTDYREAGQSVIHGHAHMARFYAEAQRIIKETTGEDVNLRMIANNIDKFGNSWSSHLSLSAARSLKEEAFVPALAGHHSSMIVFTGGGAVLEGESAFGDFIFGLSERAAVIERESGLETTADRPLVNLREESLANSEYNRRMHLITGDSVFSVASMALRAASTAIILSALEHGTRFDDLKPEDPVRALKEWSADPLLQTRCKANDGKYYTAPEHQLKMAERAMSGATADVYITPQDAYWYDRWIRVLDMARSDPMSDAFAKEVQWPVKLRRVLKAVEANRGKREPLAEYDVAFQRSVVFGQLLPAEGAGMYLARNGQWRDGPSPETIRDGLPMPDNRVKLRRWAMEQLDAYGIKYDPKWEELMIYMPLKSEYEHKYVYLRDPWAADDPKIKQTIQDIVALAA